MDETYDRGVVRWPIVVEGEGDRPPPIGRDVDPGLLLARRPEVVAWGSVEGVPWLIQAFVTAPGPDGNWWEHGPVGPGLEFALGKDGWFGGGEAGTLLNEGTHLTASVHFFGSHPDIVAWVGVVSDEVFRVEVHLDDGDDARTIDLHRGPQGFPRLFWFFSPRGAVGRIFALAADGQELQREDLVDVDVDRRSNAGTSVNPFGYSARRPPPGWPDDAAEYAPGEGPRHAEDFHLHEATFPLYVVPPNRWEGYAGLAGSGTSGERLDRVAFGYFDEPGGSRRGFEVGNERRGRRPLDRPPRSEDIGIWWSEPLPDDDAVNFAARFLSPEGQRELTGDRGWLEIGPVRIAAIVELDVAGHRVEAVRREYRRLPQLRSIQVDLPDVCLTLHGWNLTFDELEHYARVLERLELGSDLFRVMEEAQTRTKHRFDELRERNSGDRPNEG